MVGLPDYRNGDCVYLCQVVAQVKCNDRPESQPCINRDNNQAIQVLSGKETEQRNPTKRQTKRKRERANADIMKENEW